MRVKRFPIFILILFVGLVFLIDCVNRKQEKMQANQESKKNNPYGGTTNV